MESLINNPWTISIVGGIVSSVVGGLILAAITGATQGPGAISRGCDFWTRILLGMTLYGILMVFVTALAMLFYKTLANASFMGQFAGILAVGIWLFGAILLFGRIFLGWEFEDN